MLEDSQREEIARDFAWLVLLAKLPSEAAAAKFAVEEWHRAQMWVKSRSQAPGSFLWCCDVFDLEPSAVRRAITERRK